MSAAQVVVQGTLKSDGTLELDEKPRLPPGRVRITMQSVAPANAVPEDWWQYLQRARVELEAEGHQFRTKAEIDAYLADLRSGDERFEALEENRRG